MRKLAVLFVAMLVASTAYAITVTVVPSAQTVVVGSVFTLDVVVTDAGSPGVEVVDVVAAFSPSDVNALGASEGGFLYQQQVGEDLLEMLLVDNSGGVMSYTVARLGPVSSTGSGTAATLTFRCMQVSAINIGVMTSLADINGNLIDIWIDLPLVVQTPEPMTLVLIASALTAAGLLARKRS